MFCIVLLKITACYNFKGISIPPDIDTFYVENFTLTPQAIAAPINLSQDLTEELRRKIREETRLTNDNYEPDISFSGEITKYSIIPIAPEPGNTTSLNRLEISVKITYKNEKNSEDDYSKNYSDFEDFDSNQNFNALEDELTDIIIEDILERIFNDAFTGW